MKIIIKSVAVLLLILSLCGCEGNKSYFFDADMEYMVSSLGFDKQGENISVFAEIMVVNSGGSDNRVKPQLFGASGENPASALYNLHNTLAKPLMLDHCGLLVMGDGLDKQTLNEIFNILIENKNITQAIKIVSSSSAQKLLSLNAKTNIALGYELSSALKQISNLEGIDYKNRFYEIESNREKKSHFYVLPVIDVINDEYSINGIKVYHNDIPVFNAESETATIYSIMSGRFKKGEINLYGKCFEAQVRSVKYDFSYSGDTLSAEVFLYVYVNDENFSSLKKAIEDTKVEQNDIYGIADCIYAQNPKLWKRIEKNYNEVFKSAEIKFILRGADDE